MSKEKEVEFYQRPKASKSQLKDNFDTRNSTSAFICGERMKKAVMNHPEKDRTGSYAILNGRKYNIDNLLFRIDLLNRESTLLCYKLYQVAGLEGLVQGMSSPKRNLEEIEKKAKKRKKPVKKDVS